MSSGSGTRVCYTVEARSSYVDAEVIGGQVFDNRWKRVEFQQVPDGIGVPTTCSFHPDFGGGYLDYEAAEALRWWFHAGNPHSFCLETRLVSHEMKWSYEVKETGVSEAQKMPRRPWDSFAPRGADVVGESTDAPAAEGN